ncbi:MAG: DivIVA domain-containing protein [Pseudonocardiaceae bacterium]|nr:DivIVA domain-containing protein [Pseudonocardiaceae bacterium]
MGLTPEQVRQVQFDAPQAGRKGYDEDEVDTFLDLVEATLRGEGGVTDTDVRDVAFTSTALFRRGYDPDQVDAFLDEVESELQRRAESLRAAQDASLTRGGDLRAFRLPRATPPERSYAASDVDALIERAAAALDGVGGLSAEDVAAATPAPGSSVPGYRAEAVDALLGEVERELRRRDR